MLTTIKIKSKYLHDDKNIHTNFKNFNLMNFSRFN